MSVAAIVLAAGGSSRLGQPKQLIEVEGGSLVRRTVGCALEAGLAPVVVVVGAGAGPVVTELVGLDVRPVENRDWREGLASSIRAGLAVLVPRPAAVVVVPCDLPALEASVLRELAAEVAPEALAACRFEGTLGPPALFGAAHFGALERLEGDRGAKSLLIAAGERVRQIDWPAGARDVDLPGDL